METRQRYRDFVLKVSVVSIQTGMYNIVATISAILFCIEAIRMESDLIGFEVNMCEPTELLWLKISMWVFAMCKQFISIQICHVMSFRSKFLTAGSSCAMNVTAPDDLTGRADEVTDLDVLLDALSRAASSTAEEVEGQLQEVGADNTGYRGFRLRWRKRSLPEAEDVVPSPSFALRDLFKDDVGTQATSAVPDRTSASNRCGSLSFSGTLFSQWI